jgi:hypothetical protein
MVGAKRERIARDDMRLWAEWPEVATSTFSIKTLNRKMSLNLRSSRGRNRHEKFRKIWEGV